MAKWLAAAALVITTSIALPAWAGDAEDCKNAPTLLKTAPDRAFAACRHLAEQGDALAENNVGAMYWRGAGVQQDYAEAAKWYQKSADQRYAKGQYNIGY